MVLAEEGRPMGIMQIAEQADIPQATAHRLLGGLTAAGWVEKEPDTATYRLGFGIISTAAAALSQVPPFQQTHSILKQVNDKAGFAGARISVRAGRYYVPVSPLGPRTAAHSGAPGKILLAALPPSGLRDLYRGHTLRRFTPNTITNLDDLENELEHVRRNGCAVDRGESREYLRDVAVPIHDREGRVIAALSFWGTAERMTEEQIAWLREELFTCAEDLSRQASGALY
jgi:IclR family acetate operon transcriptional repressor